MHCLSVPCSESMNQNQTMAKPFSHPNPPDQFASLLQDSTRRFVADYRKGVTDFSNFGSIFSRLIHSVGDPPVEVVWFYSAVTFHGARPRLAPRDCRVSAVKELFQLLVSCSASSGAVKRIATLAPVVCELCNLASEREQFEREEIESLLEGLIGYFSICCMEIQDSGGGDHSLSSCFSDVVRAWLVDRDEVDDELEAFLPMIGDEARDRMRMVGPGGIGYLAGVVMCEAFLLTMCLKFGVEFSRAELLKEARNCAVQMITGFQCFSFFDSLLKTLLEPVLPGAKLLTSRDECLLREVLYDSVVMVDYSFFKHRLGTHLPTQHLKNLAVTWLLVADDAIRFMRKYDNQTKVISYISAFSESCISCHLIKCITNQIGMDKKIVRPNVSTPVALIKWMLLVEDQGVRVFDCSNIRANGVICKSRVEYMLPVVKTDGETPDGGDLEMVDSADASATDGQRKRKGTEDDMEVQVKFVKYQFHENSAEEKFPCWGRDDGLSSESEVQNPVRNRNMAYMQQ